MKVDLEDVPKVLSTLRLTLLALALVCLFIFDLPLIAVALASVVVALRFAMRSNRFTHWVIETLTGTKISAGSNNDPSANSSQPAHAAQSVQNYRKTPIPMSEAQITAALDARDVPAIRLRRHWPPHQPFAGNSWLGGAPALPADLDWPVRKSTGFALHHIAQIDLGDMPRLASEQGLPAAGMLWFFADIDEELDWQASAKSDHSKVLYHPKSTKGLDLAEIPQNLPEIDHRPGQMQSQKWNFKGPTFRVYPRWPITGHQTCIPRYEDNPAGVTDPARYFDAFQARENDRKEDITGPKRDERHLAPVITITVPEQRRRPDGTPFTYERKHYKADLWDGHFPYTARLGFHVLNWMDHTLSCQHSSAASQIALAQKEGEAPSERSTKSAANIAPLLPQIKELLAELAKTEPNAPLNPDQQKRFDRLMELCLDPAGASYGAEGFVKNGLIDLTAEAMSAPELLALIPPPLQDVVDATTHPAHHYTEHFVLGPKGIATNPTEGTGVRLAQFDSDYALRFMFCDCGIIDYWIDPEDLAAGRWDRAWAATAGG